MEKMLWILALIGLAQAAQYSYEGSDGRYAWPLNFPTCNGNRQSPIDLPSASDMVANTSLGTFSMSGYDNALTGNLVVLNNGHTVQISIQSASKPTLSGGGLDDTFEALQLHFHWGKTSAAGSEHTFRGRSYPFEMHIVHKNTKYSTLTDAVGYGDGIAVLGVFFEISHDDNSALTPLISALDNIKYKDTDTPIQIDFSSLLPSDLTEYYRYLGGLTTPPCSEAVIWTLFEGKMAISENQVSQFRQLFTNTQGQQQEFMALNYRPVQHLASRTVMKSYDSEVPASFVWGYHENDGPDVWKNYYSICTHDKNSPIDLPLESDTSKAVFDEDMGLDSLEFRNYENSFQGTIRNDGHTVAITIPASADLTLVNGGLGGVYRAAQFHFHWGPDNNHGSEHTLNNKAYPLEMHIVHYNVDYNILQAAMTLPKGLAVVGFFFEIGDTENPEYADLISALYDVQYKNASKVLSNINLRSLTRGDQLRVSSSSGDRLAFYRYEGGLTTPPCFETVTWTVMRSPIRISASQLAAFRDLSAIYSGTITSSDKIKENYRPTQRLGTRTVYFSYDFTTAGSGNANPSLLALACVVLVAFIRSLHI